MRRFFFFVTFLQRRAWCDFFWHYNASCCIHFAANDGTHGGGSTDAGEVPAASKMKSGLTLNPLSTAVRRFIERSPRRWGEEFSKCVDTLAMIIFTYRRGGGRAEEGRGGTHDTLHPLLAAEILGRMGFAIWTDAAASNGGWARRSGLSAEELCLLANCVLEPLLPYALTHPRVRPLLPVLVEWLVCLSDIPLLVWLPQLSFYLDNCIALGSNDRCFSGGATPDFLLRHLVTSLQFLENILLPDCESLQNVTQVFDKILRLVAGQSDGGQIVEENLCEGCYMLADCLFWQGEVPLLLQSKILRGAYAHLCHSAGFAGKEPFQSVALKDQVRPLLKLAIANDDMFRRFLLRLLVPGSFCPTTKAMGAVDDLDCVVLVEPMLQLEESSLKLSLIMPLSDFVSVLFEKGVFSPLKLSFNGIKAVLYVTIGELQTIQKQAPSSSYSLLPHKARIHALKALCERLLSRITHELHSHTFSPTFPGVSLQEQLVTIQSFSFATRRLIRAVMTEKTLSLQEEGSAESIATRHHDVTTVLRNTAFRVLEPLLLRYYNALEDGVSFFADEDDYVKKFVKDIEHHAGDSSTLFTAWHILRNPLRNDVAAVVEALRLVAIQSLVLRSPRCKKWLEENYTTVLADAFFSIWHRTMRNECSILKTTLSQGEAMTHNSDLRIEEGCLILWRVLWTMLFLHQSSCLACASQECQPHFALGSISSCTVLRSLLGLLTTDGTCTQFASFGWPFPSSCKATFFCMKETEKREDEWKEETETIGNVEGNPDGFFELWTRHVIYGSGASNVACGGKITRWELQEELLFLSSGGGSSGGGVKFCWLGTARAVRWALSALGTPTTCAKSNANFAGFLLPWTAVALSRHPLRFYDESGASAAAASAFDADIRQLLQILDGKVFRVVGVDEEALFFRDMAFTPELSLGSCMTVINPDVCRAQGQRCMENAQSFATDDSEDEYDGLD